MRNVVLALVIVAILSLLVWALTRDEAGLADRSDSGMATDLPREFGSEGGSGAASGPGALHESGGGSAAMEQNRETNGANSTRSHRDANSGGNRATRSGGSGLESASGGAGDGGGSNPGGTLADTTDWISISGAIAVRSPVGDSNRSESGAMDIVHWSGDQGTHATVTINNGRWQSRVPAGSRVSFKNIRLGGNTAELQGNKAPREVPASGQFQLEAVWEAATQLFVVSTTTGEQLTDITIVEATGAYGRSNSHPGRIVGSDAQYHPSSPIWMPRGANRGRRTYFVHSVGYAWDRVVIDSASQVERVVELEPGGELDVTLQGDDRPTGLRLRLRRASRVSDVICEDSVGALDELTWEGIEPGRYLVRAELGEPHQTPVVFASAEVQITAHEVQSVALKLKPAPDVEEVDLQVTVLLPSEWPVTGRLDVRQLDVSKTGVQVSETRSLHRMDSKVSGSGVLLSWDVGPVEVGRYEFELSSVSYKIVTEVNADNRRVRVDVPRGADVEVTLTDKDGGVIEEVARVSWSGDVRAARRPGVQMVTRDPESGTFLFRAPIMDIHVSAGGNGYWAASRKFTVQEGTNRFSLVLEVATGLWVRLRDGEAYIPLDWKNGMRLEAVEQAGQVVSWSGNGHFRVSQPGVYVLRIPTIDGYEPIEPEEVEIREGVTEELVIELQRTP